MNHVRKYYFHVDCHGRLFNELTYPRNIATSLKSPKFLAFFFQQLRMMENPSFHNGKEYKYLSPCQGEENYVECEETPIVFTDFDSSKKGLILNYSMLSCPFDPSKLYLSESSGRLYHPLLTNHRHMKNEFCLIRSSLTMQLSENFQPCPETRSGLSYQGFPIHHVE